jgi:prepilin-type N-terminal cleavage/methylation domain-containing protein
MRRGFTLVELMIGLVLLLAVGGVTSQLLLNSQRVSHWQAQHVSMQDNVRSGALIIANELREVGYDQLGEAAIARFPGSALVAGPDPDLIALGPDSITYRAMRLMGFTCSLSGAAGASGELVVRNATARYLRTLTTSDSLMLYVENDPSTPADDMWLPAGITAAPGNQSCPDGSAGTQYRFTIPPLLAVTADAAFGNMVIGGPVRAFEVMQMRSYVSGRQAWLGMRSASVPNSSIQPILGPLSQGSGRARGLSLTYWNVNNLATSVPNEVRSIQVALKSVTDEPVRTTGRYAAIDSLTLTTRVALRNALRP